jgi:hypothetical protein
MPKRTQRLGRGLADINAARENLMANAISTESGRIALGQAMVEPLRRVLDYQGVGRQLLMVDDLPEGGFNSLYNIQAREYNRRRRENTRIAKEQKLEQKRLARELRIKEKLITKIEKMRRTIRDPISYLEI